MLTSTTPPRSSAITTHHFPKNFRRHAGPPPPADWEWALREAAYQALVREGYSEPSLHDYIFDAPMSGRTHGASPFGDVAMLARGQLYLTQSGFHFVQDPNAYDCDYCSPTVENRHKPIAVWTVRRIRHRDQTGHRHELEYTVSPVRGGDYATENGNYNYALPGHVFVVVTETNDRAKYHNRYDVTANRNPHRGYLPVKAENRDRHYLPPHTTPQSIDYYKPGNEIHKSQSDLERELELYKKLVQSLAMRVMDTTTPRLTTTTSSHTTASDFDIFEDVTPLTAPVTVKTTPVDVTTIVHLTTPIVTSRPQTTPKTLASPTTQTTPPLDVATIVHLTTPIVTSRPQKTSNMIVFPTTPFIPSPTYVVYSEPDPLYSSTSTTTNQQTKPPTFVTTTPRSSTTRFSKSKPTHRRKATDTRPTKATSFSSVEDDIFGSLKPPQPPKMTMTYPESIEQLPPPEKDADATTAYVGEIVTETSKLTQPTSTKSTIKTTKKYVRAKKLKGTKQSVATITTHKKPITKQPKVVATTTKTPPTKQLPNVTVTIKPTTQSTHNVNEVLNKTSPMVQTVTEEITLDEITIKSIVTEEITTKIPPTTGIITRATRAPPTTSKIAPTTSKIPTTSNIPLTTSKIPPTTSKIPTTSNAPPTTNKIPPTTSKLSPSTTQFTEEIATTSEPPEDESSKSDETTQTPTRETKPETGTKQSTTVEIETETERLTTEATAIEETTQIDNTSTPTSQISMDEIATTKVTTYVVTTDTQIVTITTTLKPDETTMKIDQTTPTTARTTRTTLDALDEIFGEVATENKPTSTIAPTKPKNTEEIDELFDEKPKKSKKRLVLNAIRPVTASTNAPKIIYSNFYAAATDDVFVDPDLTTRNSAGPPTSQSYSTSVSFEVNKKTGPSVRAKVVEVDADDPEYSVFRAESPDETTETTTNDRETTKVFDEIALSLVNHARSIDYVSSKEEERKKKRKN